MLHVTLEHDHSFFVQFGAQCAGVPTVKFGGVTATGVKVAGDAWITGLIPSNSAGKCTTSVTISDGVVTLELPEAFCYLS